MNATRVHTRTHGCAVCTSNVRYVLVVITSNLRCVIVVTAVCTGSLTTSYVR